MSFGHEDVQKSLEIFTAKEVDAKEEPPCVDSLADLVEFAPAPTYPPPEVDAQGYVKRGMHHPVQPVLDQIDIASSFAAEDGGQQIRVLIKKVRTML